MVGDEAFAGAGLERVLRHEAAQQQQRKHLFALLRGLIRLPQRSQPGLHLAAEGVALVFGQGNVEADGGLAELVSDVQQHVKGQPVAGQALLLGVVGALPGQQLGGRGFYLIHGRDVEVGIVGVAAPNQRRAAPDVKLPRSQAVEREPVGAFGHRQPAAERDGAGRVDVGRELPIGPHPQVVARNRVDNDGERRPVRDLDAGRQVVAGGAGLHRVQGQLPGQGGVEPDAFVDEFDDALALHGGRVAGRRLHRQVGAFGHGHVRIDLDERERPTQARVRIEHQPAVVERVVGAGAAHGQEVFGAGPQVKRVIHVIAGQQVAVGHGPVAGRIQHRKIIKSQPFLIEYDLLIGQPVGRAELRHDKGGIVRSCERAAHLRHFRRAGHGQRPAQEARRPAQLPDRKRFYCFQVQPVHFHLKINRILPRGDVEAHGVHVVTGAGRVRAGAGTSRGRATQAGVHVVAVGDGVAGFQGEVTEQGPLINQVADGQIGRKREARSAQPAQLGLPVEGAGHQRVVLLHGPRELSQLELLEAHLQRRGIEPRVLALQNQRTRPIRQAQIAGYHAAIGVVAHEIIGAGRPGVIVDNLLGRRHKRVGCPHRPLIANWLAPSFGC